MWNWSASLNRASPARQSGAADICVKMIVNVGIVRIIVAGDYPDPLAVEMLANAGVTLERLSLDVPVPD